MASRKLRGEPEPAKQELAQRYAAWLRKQMTESRLNQPEVAKAAGLKKQQVNTILAERAYQPTAAQIAGFARAFDVTPSEIFRALGLWDGMTNMLEPRLAEAYDEMTGSERLALIRISYALLEKQEERSVAESDAPYSDDDSEPTDILPPAAAPHKLQPVDPWPPLDPEADDEP